MPQEVFNQAYFNEQWVVLFIQVMTLFAASYFAWAQYKINDRLKKLQDYVAVIIVPVGPGDLRLQIINVGRINLYLQKYEIGTNHEMFAKPMLIPAGSNSILMIPIKSYVPSQKMDVTLYLIDELGEKFISTGETTVENIPVQRQPQPNVNIGSTATTFETVVVPQATAWSYKTIRRNWTL